MLSRSFSSEKSYSPSRLKIEVPPGSRRAVGHRIEECLPFSGCGGDPASGGQDSVIPGGPWRTRSLAAWRPSRAKCQFTVCSNSASVMPREMRIIRRSPIA